MSRLLILAEGPGVGLRDPLDQIRPAFLLRNGAWTIAHRWALLLKPDCIVAGVRPWLRGVVAEQTGWEVNATVDAPYDDVWIVTGCPTPASYSDLVNWRRSFTWVAGSDSVVRLDQSHWNARRDRVNDWVMAGATETVPVASDDSIKDEVLVGATGLWDLVNRIPTQLAIDAQIWRQEGRKKEVIDRHPMSALVRDDNIYFGRDVNLAAHTVLDATGGPIIIDERVRIEPFTRIDGPAYIGADTRLAGGKIVGGCAIGPGCRIGGELEASIIQGFTNKVHEGFFGHGFLGEWVNLGALTTNSDLKNTYGTVRVRRAGKVVDTGCLKVGSYLSDHTKMGIGTLLPTGATMGVGVNCAVGRLTESHIPPFVWNAGGTVTEHDIERMLPVAAIAIERRAHDRRGQNLPAAMTDAEKSALRHLFESSREERHQHIQLSVTPAGR